MRIKEFPQVVFITVGEDTNGQDEWLEAHFTKSDALDGDDGPKRVALYKFEGMQELHKAVPISREIKRSRKTR
jgi:hypothetical protein